MFNTFGKLLCAAALASAALAQNITLSAPASASAYSVITVEVAELQTPNTITEIALAIGLIACPTAGCSTPSEDLGSILYSGPYAPQSTNSAGNLYENFTVTVPGFLEGDVQLGAVVFSLAGAYSTPGLNRAITTLMVTGATG